MKNIFKGIRTSHTEVLSIITHSYFPQTCIYPSACFVFSKGNALDESLLASTPIRWPHCCAMLLYIIPCTVWVLKSHTFSVTNILICHNIHKRLKLHIKFLKINLIKRVLRILLFSFIMNCQSHKQTTNNPHFKDCSNNPCCNISSNSWWIYGHITFK